MSVFCSADHTISDRSVASQAIRVLLVYPNTREVALANLGFQQVHALLNSIDDVECDRYALPTDWKPEIETLNLSPAAAPLEIVTANPPARLNLEPAVKL